MSTVLYERDGAVATLVLNRPTRRNALSAELVEALHAALDRAEADEQVGAVVLTGAGKSFCAGGDLAGGMAGAGFLAGHEGRGRFAQLVGRIPKSPLPVLAAVQGDALGGGLGIVAACDMAWAHPTARLGTPEIRVGLFPWIIMAPLRRHLGPKQLHELVMTGEKISADRGVALGLLNGVAEDVRAHVTERAHKVAGCSPAIMRMGKAAMVHTEDMSWDESLAYLHTQLTLNLLTEDAAEGVTAFLEKREPTWKGR